MNGIDISNNNGAINWSKVAGAGVTYVYMKATEGSTFVDGYLEANYAGAIENGLKVGFYHFLTGGSSPEAQAEAFYAQIGNKTNHLHPCLDTETNGYDVNNYVVRFIAHFATLCDMQLCIYSGPYYANEHFKDTSIANCPYWVASYGVSNPQTTNMWGANRAGWQYSDKGSIAGVSGNCDVNDFNDSILLGTEWTGNGEGTGGTGGTGSTGSTGEDDVIYRDIMYGANIVSCVEGDQFLGNLVPINIGQKYCFLAGDIVHKLFIENSTQTKLATTFQKELGQSLQVSYKIIVNTEAE